MSQKKSILDMTPEEFKALEQKLARWRNATNDAIFQNQWNRKMDELNHCAICGDLVDTNGQGRLCSTCVAKGYKCSI